MPSEAIAASGEVASSLEMEEAAGSGMDPKDLKPYTFKSLQSMVGAKTTAGSETMVDHRRLKSWSERLAETLTKEHSRRAGEAMVFFLSLIHI